MAGPKLEASRSFGHIDVRQMLDAFPLGRRARPIGKQLLAQRTLWPKNDVVGGQKIVPDEEGVDTRITNLNEAITVALGQMIDGRQGGTEVGPTVVLLCPVELRIVRHRDRAQSKGRVVFRNDQCRLRDNEPLQEPVIVAIDIHRQNTERSRGGVPQQHVQRVQRQPEGTRLNTRIDQPGNFDIT